MSEELQTDLSRRRLHDTRCPHCQKNAARARGASHILTLWSLARSGDVQVEALVEGLEAVDHEDDASRAQDMLADLLHLAHRERWDVEALIRLAKRNCEAELEGDGVEEAVTCTTYDLHAVRDVLVRTWCLEGVHVDYPGFITIPESVINDEMAASDNVWCVGPGEEPGTWTGQLMNEDGSDVIDAGGRTLVDPRNPALPGKTGLMAFRVYPKSTSPEDIADAVYYHGICHWYHVEPCTADCPRNKQEGV